MKFFVDTADVEEIRELAASGLLDGVTTNPSLVAKTGRGFFEVLEEICGLVEGPVSAEVAATTYDRMLAEGRRLAEARLEVLDAPGHPARLPEPPGGLGDPAREEQIAHEHENTRLPHRSLSHRRAGAGSSSASIPGGGTACRGRASGRRRRGR